MDTNITLLDLDSRIGMLAGGQFYAFPNGYGQPEVRGTREEVEVALGLRAAVTPAAKPAPAAKKARSYIVTMKHAAYFAGGACIDGGETEITAATSGEAISEARRRYRENEGRERMPATFTARLAA